MKPVALCLVLTLGVPLLSACGSERPDSGDDETHVANVAAVTVNGAGGENRARQEVSAAPQEEWWSGLTGNERNPVVVLPQSLICGRAIVEPGLPVELTGDDTRRGYVHHLFRRVRTRLEALNIPLNRPGDTAGHRTRNSSILDSVHCAESRTHIDIVIHIRPLEEAGENPPTSRIRIAPYVLTVSARSSGGNWHAMVRRKVSEIHPAVFPDPRVATIPSATSASIINDISDLSQSLRRSIAVGAAQ